MKKIVSKKTLRSHAQVQAGLHTQEWKGADKWRVGEEKEEGPREGIFSYDEYFILTLNGTFQNESGVTSWTWDMKEASGSMEEAIKQHKGG